MIPKNFGAVLKLGDGKFLPAFTESQVRGIAPTEVWIFGNPRTTKELFFAESLRSGYRLLPETKIHHL